MMTRQALIAIGGKARRLREAGFKVDISKSFIKVLDEPLLHWNLMALHTAGIRRLVLCGDTQLQLCESEIVIHRLAGLGFDFSHVQYFNDPGLGVHGLPYQAKRHGYRLDKTFIFECGHSLMLPQQYRNLNTIKADNNVVFSAFVPHPSNYRQPVELAGRSVRLLHMPEDNCHVIAHPLLVDHAYIERLPSLNFKIEEIIRYYAQRSGLRYVISEMPPEFDVPEELAVAMARYHKYLGHARLPSPNIPSGAY
jgi:hypothetical protein